MFPGLGEQAILLGIIFYFLFKWLPLSMAISIIIGAIIAAYMYLNHSRKFWQRRGINGPPANVLFGHTFSFQKGMHKCDLEWTAKYGSYYGTYILGYNDLTVSDIGMLRQIFVKDFPHFTNRLVLPIQKLADPKTALVANVLTVLENEQWKNVRSAITPAFTTGKIKNSVPVFNDCAKTLCDIFAEHSAAGKAVPLKEIFSRMTMDVIARSVFALDANTQRDDGSPFLKHAKTLFEIGFTSPGVFLTVLFPHIAAKFERWTGHYVIADQANQFFKSTLNRLYDERVNNPKFKDSKDFFQMLINSANDTSSGAKITNPIEDKDIIHADYLKSSRKTRLNKIEIVSQCFLFLLAGYETTASTLHLAIYLLALHPEWQEKCRREVLEIIGNNGDEDAKDEITYEHITKMQLVDQVINETMRLYPATARTNRVCNESVTINGVTIEKGCSIQVPIWVIHHDEQHYPDPELFDPDRFTKENCARRDPLTFLPFGFGPRNCIGMRFAQFEMRIAIAHILKRFNLIVPDDGQRMPIAMNTQRLTIPEQPLMLKFEAIQSTGN